MSMFKKIVGKVVAGAPKQPGRGAAPPPRMAPKQPARGAAPTPKQRTPVMRGQRGR